LDGIMGDAAHQLRVSDHNTGNAFDLTHDPASGADGELVSGLAIQDPRVTYVIWNERIFNRSRAAEGWRPYVGTPDNPKDPHTHHVHVSIRPEARNDVTPWAWSPLAPSA
jgi:hypothetical protein